MIRAALLKLIEEAYQKACEGFHLKPSLLSGMDIEVPKEKSHGDLSSNIALVSSKALRKPPMEIAEAIAASFPGNPVVEKIQTAPPGFVNFFLSKSYLQAAVAQILREGSHFGKMNVGRGERVQVEFVSANPTGPLHIGNGRGGAIGDTYARLLAFLEFAVQKEYYVNDADMSTQVGHLARSLEIRYRQQFDERVELDEEGYQGEYLVQLAQKIAHDRGKSLLDLPAKERRQYFQDAALKEILESHKQDLQEFGVQYDDFFNEQTLYKKNNVDEVIQKLKEKGYTYEAEGAVWFASTTFGDKKDQVLVRSDGKPTYLAADIAYHKNKFDRGFQRVIDIWGADHHGHVPKVKAALHALGYDPEKLKVILYQMVSLTSEGEAVKMSKREGEMVTLRELVQEVGRDAARFFFLSRDHHSALDFDLELAKKKSMDNPVYYVQYAYSRVCSVIRKSREQGLNLDYKAADINYNLLTEEEELDLLKKLVLFPDFLAGAAESGEMHRLTNYARELSEKFHIFYQKHRILSEDAGLSAARLGLVVATQVAVQNLLGIMGISCPERM